MTVTFNDMVLADGDSRICKVASGLAPSGELGMEALEYLRAEWAVPVARGNRLITLPMIIELVPCADFETSLVQHLMYFKNLPAEGELKIQHGGALVTFSQAVCKTNKTRELEGLQNTVMLTFVCGEPVNSTLSILAQMDSRYTANMSSITGLTGGGSTKLDGLVTTDVAVGRLINLVINNGTIDELQFWKLYAGTDAEDTGSGIVRPDDYDGSDNAKVWKRML